MRGMDDYMKKILFTANLESFFTKFLIPQLEYFKNIGYEVHIAAKSENKIIPFCDKKFNVDFARSFNLKQNIKSYKELKEILKNEHYDIISCHTPFGGAITRLVAKNLKLKNTRVVYMAHGFHFYKGQPKLKYNLFYTAEKYLAKFTDEIITINLDDYEVAKKNFKTKVTYVPGVGLDESKFNFKMSKEEKIELRKSLGLKKSDFVMIFPAEISIPKRHCWLINTIHKLLKENKNFHLLLPGKDSLNGQCQKLTKEINLENQIHFLGFRNDIPKLLNIADLAVSSSIREGLPVNVMEAIYVGIPVIATDCRGNKDLIHDNKNGYIIDVDDRNDFCEKVIKVYNFTQKEKNNIKEKDKKIIEKYLLKNVLDKIIKVYLKK